MLQTKIALPQVPPTYICEKYRISAFTGKKLSLQLFLFSFYFPLKLDAEIGPKMTTVASRYESDEKD